jgi:hypothetical protein
LAVVDERFNPERYHLDIAGFSLSMKLQSVPLEFSMRYVSHLNLAISQLQDRLEM